MNVFEHKLNLRVYYEDTDAEGIVYHSNYLNFCERARTEILRELRITHELILKKHNAAFVVAKAQIDYVVPAKLDDLLTVITAIESISAAKLVFIQNIYRDKEQILCCRVKVTIACIDTGKMRATKIPLSIKNKFLRILNGDID